MPRVGVSREEVFEIAHRLHLERKNVTVAGVRETLGRGSLSTIHKHLKSWLKQSPGYDIDTDRGSPTIPFIYIESLKEKILSLEGDLLNLKAKNDILNKEIIDRESVIGSKNTIINDLIDKNDNSSQECSSYKSKYANCLEKLKLLEGSHKIHLDKITRNYESRITSLMEEIKDVLISSRDEIRSLSSKHTDDIMELKTKIILLEDKLNNKEKLIEKMKFNYTNSGASKRIEKLEEENSRLLQVIAKQESRSEYES